MPSWRPEQDWVNPFQHRETCVIRADDGRMMTPVEIFEAGADALLEALRQATVHFAVEGKGNCHMFHQQNTEWEGGLWVFIPDDDSPSCGLAKPK